MLLSKNYINKVNIKEDLKIWNKIDSKILIRNKFISFKNLNYKDLEINHFWDEKYLMAKIKKRLFILQQKSLKHKKKNKRIYQIFILRIKIKEDFIYYVKLKKLVKEDILYYSLLNNILIGSLKNKKNFLLILKNNNNHNLFSKFLIENNICNKESSIFKFIYELKFYFHIIKYFKYLKKINENLLEINCFEKKRNYSFFLNILELRKTIVHKKENNQILENKKQSYKNRKLKKIHKLKCNLNLLKENNSNLTANDNIKEYCNFRISEISL